MLGKASDQHIHHKKLASQGFFFFFFSFFYAENTANLQIRAGREFFGGVQPVHVSEMLLEYFGNQRIYANC